MSATGLEISPSSEAKTEPTEEDLILLYDHLFEGEDFPHDSDFIKYRLNNILLELGWTMPLSEFEKVVRRWSK